MKLPWRYILVSLAIGLLLGGAAGIFYSRGITTAWTPKSAEMFLRRLDNELKLTEPQRTQIRSLLSANRDKLAAFQEEIRKTTRREIRGLLTSDQLTRFDAMVARRDAERKKQEGR
jgi:Spy/CpxP family protein refolding chaperone